MTGSNHTRFRLLIGWCCMMSSALLSGSPGKSNSPASSGKTDKQIDTWRDQSFNDYIHLIRDREKTWICSEPCTNSSLSLKNATVELTVSGLYYIYAQVYFKSTDHKQLANVTLLRKEGPGIQEKRLSVVRRNGPGSLTMSCLIQVVDKISISLNIEPITFLSGEYYDTYWDIILLKNK
ncbi:lymphotoxin-alpha isoform X2 [Labeo rohita]|uniref:lymphotoxin-alpha isoform X2 n=1 Tax=Labeo rohita TaxID=84645 RepID=UPI0021E29C1A|nr:lymphotoxin-alpha isoform X2 [Labeo rohita]